MFCNTTTGCDYGLIILLKYPFYLALFYKYILPLPCLQQYYMDTTR